MAGASGLRFPLEGQHVPAVETIGASANESSLTGQAWAGGRYLDQGTYPKEQQQEPTRSRMAN